MSVNGYSSRGRNNSGELDVFEAARYFSSTNENPIQYTGPNFSQDVKRVGHISLDMPMQKQLYPLNPSYNHLLDLKKIKENKKYKQPSSPRSRLASFLNSLFKDPKKKKLKSGSNTKDIDQQEIGNRKRRSSISHFRFSTITELSSGSGFRTPPPCTNTPKKSYNEFKMLSHNNKMVSLPKPTTQNELRIEYDGKFSFSSEKIMKNIGFVEKEFTKFSNDCIEGAESDSSSDLFDLPNHDLDFYPTGLPVYEITQMDKIKIGY